MSLPILFTVQEFEEKIKAWCKEAGEDVTYDFAQVRCIFLHTKHNSICPDLTSGNFMCLPGDYGHVHTVEIQE